MTDFDFSYHASGPEEGTPVLFLHGFLGCKEDWQEVIARLSETFRCIAVDLPGHGGTAAELADPGPHSKSDPMRLVARRLISFMDRLELGRSFLVGYSMGGRLSLLTALLFPDRFRGLVLESASPGIASEEERLARIDADEALARRLEAMGDGGTGRQNGPGGLSSNSTLPAQADQQRPVGSAAAGFGTFLDDWYGAPLFGAIKSHPDFGTLRQKRLDNDPRALALVLRRLGAGHQVALQEFWAECRLPALLIAGEKDLKYSRIVSDMARTRRDASLSIIEGAGHCVHWEQRDAFIAALLDFFNDIA